MEGMVTIFHNPRCSKSRQTKEILDAHGMSYTAWLYLENPMPKEVLVAALETLGEDVMLRTGEADYKAHIKGKALHGDALADVMLAYPKTIERPLVINGDKMAMGRPPEAVEEIL